MRKMIMTLAVSAVTALLLGGCASGTSAPAHSPSVVAHAWLPAGAVVHRDVVYGADPLQTLDVYIPEGAHGAPILLMVHGGGWVRGDKAAAGVVNNKVAHYLPKGFVFVSVNYRFSPAVTPVDEAGDVASALAFVQKHAADWGGAAQNVVLVGHSAGANLVSLVAADPSFAAKADATGWLGTIALDSAAFNVVTIMEKPHLSLYDPVFGDDQQLWRAASPTLRLMRVPAPMLLVCASGRADSCAQAQAFAAQAYEHAGESSRAHVQVYPVAMKHGGINSELGTSIDLTRTVDGFLASLGLKNVGNESG